MLALLDRLGALGTSALLPMQNQNVNLPRSLSAWADMVAAHHDIPPPPTPTVVQSPDPPYVPDDLDVAESYGWVLYISAAEQVLGVKIRTGLTDARSALIRGAMIALQEQNVRPAVWVVHRMFEYSRLATYDPASPLARLGQPPVNFVYAKSKVWNEAAACEVYHLKNRQHISPAGRELVKTWLAMRRQLLTDGYDAACVARYTRKLAVLKQQDIAASKELAERLAVASATGEYLWTV